MVQTLRIATRESPLAVWQAEFVKQALCELHPELQVVLVPMTTRGDQIIDRPLAKIGGKGLFVKELEHALLENRADLAVHSMKDVPMEFPAGLQLTAICQRENPFDALVAPNFSSLADLPVAARIGTSSARRRSQLLAARPDLNVLDLRGNVHTRLRKLHDGAYDAIVLAVAGLQRLALEQHITEVIAAQISLPAPGQGAVGIETRISDEHTNALLASLNHFETSACVRAERAMTRGLQGSCETPIAAYARFQHGQVSLQARVLSLDGATVIAGERQAASTQAEALGMALAAELLVAGADKILAALTQPD